MRLAWVSGGPMTSAPMIVTTACSAATLTDGSNSWTFTPSTKRTIIPDASTLGVGGWWTRWGKVGFRRQRGKEVGKVAEGGGVDKPLKTKEMFQIY